MVANRRHSQPKKAKPSKLPLQTSPKATDEHDLESNKSNSEELSDGRFLLSQLQSILREKAPEALPLLDQLWSTFKPDSKAIVEEEKRGRSIVISGVPEAENAVASQRQAHTENAVLSLLDKLDIETRPVEISRLGSINSSSPRLIKCVFSSKRYYLEALRKARLLRGIPDCSEIYIRRSMTRAERENDKALRQKAREMNKKEFNGNKVYVVYRDSIVKASEIPKIKESLQKN
ncbi:hypothetical protein Y032_0043g763 [Ancylostoma ceylanicum]|uniref:Uncharacterized protein n=1 Tax=Ancylostoma ceylanicum TaxID=53326 RepID=A0A016UG04_9BILA|nr:hypothetical protein Y032_0043g763 [Ancylostoma ceylanicum]